MCGHSLAASVDWGSRFLGAVWRLLVSFFVFGQIRTVTDASGLSCVVKTVPKVVDGWFPFCLKPFGDC